MSKNSFKYLEAIVMPIICLIHKYFKKLFIFLFYIFVVFCLQVQNSISDQNEIIVSTLKQWVAQDLNVKFEDVEVVNFDSRISVKKCVENIYFDYPFENRDTVRAKCNNPKWQLFLRIKVSVEKNVFVYAKDLKKGTVINRIHLKKKKISSSNKISIEKLEDIVGRITIINVQKDQVIKKKHFSDAVGVLKATKVIQKGDKIDNTNSQLVFVPNNSKPSNAIIGQIKGNMVASKDLLKGKIIFKNDIFINKKVVVVTTNLSTGQKLDFSFLTKKKILIESLNEQYLTSTNGLDLHEVTRPIKDGEPLKMSDVRPALLIKKGDLVSFFVKKGSSFIVTIQLKALESGRLGEQINFLNEDSGKKVRGIVVGFNKAEGI